MNLNFNKKQLIISILLLLVLLISIGNNKFELTKMESVQASHLANVSGYAWADTPQASNSTQGIGWVSFNSKNCDSNDNGTSDPTAPAGCPKQGSPISNYGVNIDPSSLKLAGYAWSEAAGWISFQETSGCPGGSCGASFVKKSANLYEMQGWAKVLSMTDPQADGWIALNCSNASGAGGNICSTSQFGVTLSVTEKEGGTMTGYAWGGEVIGWVSFSGDKYKVTTSAFPFVPSGGGPGKISPVSSWKEVAP
ncbi:hypothetical protein HY061_03520 [Candidatus Azambacteria bacterium]|nr:hypothetical protein [Candidatus Azambacteria bacterium]